jgi:nucleotide-binding universal stress UspA family protein
MSSIQKPHVVAADDFSETGLLALQEALRRPCGHLHVVHVVTDEDLAHVPGETLLERQNGVLEILPAKLWDRVGTAGAHIGGVPQLHVSVHVRFGVPSAAITQVAADYDADMIVAGTHGRRGMERFVLGSVAEALVRRAACPVLIVREKDHASMRKSDRPEPAIPGEDLRRQRPASAHVYTSTQVVRWTGRDVETVGVDFGG